MTHPPRRVAARVSSVELANRVLESAHHFRRASLFRPPEGHGWSTVRILLLLLLFCFLLR